MGKVTLKYKKEVVKKRDKKITWEFLDTEEFNKFNPSVLGLGDISLGSTRVEAIAAVFDLSGFTKFCSQVDPHLSVPKYLNGFLDWLFYFIKKEFVEKSSKKGKTLWANLPFLAKFLGDGVLFLWNTENMDEVEICNVASILKEICDDYVEIFYADIKKEVVEPPSALRCGIARGSVFSVGDGNDYVGPCINIASRLQKLSLLTFCISHRGFDFKNYMHEDQMQKYVIKSVSLRGIGENELVWVLKQEFNGLPKEEKNLLKKP